MSIIVVFLYYYSHKPYHERSQWRVTCNSNITFFSILEKKMFIVIIKPCITVFDVEDETK